ncbi:MAG: hypothetical protein DI598_01080 [Pseudopedobacter saltans]|uniref:Uncharacterized protein n=1 Tax=Pseudopedobacter saltans TaxID=151895 RepID=A0A2W5HF16_9SPHI|nr:MAG: hypothetical protein DI598_01080 [Pseudopedobacter saltans]
MYSIYYIVIGAVVVIMVITLIMANIKKAQQKSAYLSLDVNAEALKTNQYMNESLDNNYYFIKHQMNEELIDAFTSAFVEHGVKDEIADQTKNLLKGMATLGTVRFRTVHTPKYITINGDSIHLFDVDKNGDIDTHLVFDQGRMSTSTIEEILDMRKENVLGNFSLRYYRISFSTDDKPIRLVISNILTDINAVPSYDVQDQIQNFVVANHFLNTLGQKYPHLRVHTDIPSA